MTGSVTNIAGGRTGMGTYLFERTTADGAGRDASESLQDDVSKALDEIDWVDTFAIRMDLSNEEVVGADITFDPEWPDIRTSNPGQVAGVFLRLGLRTIANPSLASQRVSADDPLGVDDAEADESFDLFEFSDDSPDGSLDLNDNP